MKKTTQIYVTALVALAGFSCQDQAVRESMATNSPEGARIVKNEALFAAVPLSTRKVCGQPDNQRCNHEMQQLQIQLMKLDPIPVPQGGEQPALSVSKADELYRQFVADHANEPIVSVFRQLYARAMLNQYGILTGNDFERIRYYTMELVDENSMDFATLTTAMTRLRGTIPKGEFTRLVNSTAERAQTFSQYRQRHADELAVALTRKATKQQLMATKLEMDHIRQSINTTDIDKLTRLQASVRHVDK